MCFSSRAEDKLVVDTDNSIYVNILAWVQLSVFRAISLIAHYAPVHIRAISELDPSEQIELSNSPLTVLQPAESQPGKKPLKCMQVEVAEAQDKLLLPKVPFHLAKVPANRQLPTTAPVCRRKSQFESPIFLFLSIPLPCTTSMGFLVVFFFPPRVR